MCYKTNLSWIAVKRPELHPHQEAELAAQVTLTCARGQSHIRFLVFTCQVGRVAPATGTGVFFLDAEMGLVALGCTSKNETDLL